MEEEKAAAYYDELARKGEGAARFKRGLGFSSTSSTKDGDDFPVRGSALPSSSSSFLSSFVKASSPAKTAEFERQAQLETIQNKLKKKPVASSTSEIQRSSSRVSRDIRRSSSKDGERELHSRRRSRSRSQEGRDSRHRHRHRQRHRSSSRDKDRDRYGETERDRVRERRRRRSRSWSVSDDDRHRRRDRGRNRSESPRDRRPERSGGDRGKQRVAGKVGKERNGAIDYAKLIEGYDKMSPAERVKAKMKLQLSETVEKDATKGTGSGWERFEFNKDAPLDDEEMEAVEDDAALVKHIGQSFRYSAVEKRREEQIKAAHDKAMFGASSIPPSVNTEDEEQQENNEKENAESVSAASLLSDKVISRQQGSWRDRARKT